MKRSDYKYFYIQNYLNISLHDLILEELNALKDTSFIVNENGTISETDQGDGHIRNNRIEDDVINEILTPGIKQYKDLIKHLMKEKGMVLPTIRGILNYHNPESIKWHQDFVSNEMYIDPQKRFVTFYVVSNQKLNSTFMVGPNLDGPGLWNLGFKINLEPNLLIAHNQNLGHEYMNMGTKDIHILSMLWYDMY